MVIRLSVWKLVNWLVIRLNICLVSRFKNVKNSEIHLGTWESLVRKSLNLPIEEILWKNTPSEKLWILIRKLSTRLVIMQKCEYFIRLWLWRPYNNHSTAPTVFCSWIAAISINLQGPALKRAFICKSRPIQCDFPTWIALFIPFIHSGPIHFLAFVNSPLGSYELLSPERPKATFIRVFSNLRIPTLWVNILLTIEFHLNWAVKSTKLKIHKMIPYFGE